MSARKSYRPWQPRQAFLLPPSPTDWLPDNHLVFFILDVVEQLDLSVIEQRLAAKDLRGERPYAPQMMMGLLLYAYCVGVFSSRKIEQARYDNVAFRVLTGGLHPHFTTVNNFRKNNLDVLKGVFRDVLLLCRKAGLVKLGHVALDGSKLQGNASKHKAMSYEFMQDLEKRLETEIAELLAQADRADSEDDERLGEGVPEQDIPAELGRREERLTKIREAKAALEEEARKARAQHHRELAQGCQKRAADEAAAASDRRRNLTLAATHEQKALALSSSDDDDDEPPSGFTTEQGLPKHRPRTKPDGTPHPKAQRNFTDPDSRIQESGGNFIQGYNCQAAVDAEHQIIVGEAVTNQPPDNGHLEPMLDQVVANCGAGPDALSADSGFWNEDVPNACATRDTEPYVATERHKHWHADDHRTEGPPPPAAAPREAMRHKLRSAEGRQIYSRRKVIVEPVFGQIKEVRGFRRFSLRGLSAVGGEWSLVCATHNLLKLFRAFGAVPV
jgi:transposase